MAIDKQFYEPSITPYKDWLNQNKDKANNESYIKLAEMVVYVENTAETESDITAFFGKLTAEDIFTKMGTLMSEAMTASSGSTNRSASSGGNDDKAILNQYVAALENSLTTLKQQTKNIDANSIRNLQNTESIIEAIEQLIALAKQPDMSSPQFLRLQIEKGLDKALEGKLMMKNYFIVDSEMNKAIASNPYEIKASESKVLIYNELSEKSCFGIPDSIELQYAIKDIDYDIEYPVLAWHNIQEKTEDMITHLAHWSLSFCSFAPSIQPWSLSVNPKEAVIETQETYPGIFKNKEKSLQKYFGFNFMDLMMQSSTLWDIENNNLTFSQEFAQFLVSEIYPACLGGTISKSQIADRANFYTEKKEENPSTMSLQRMQDFYKKHKLTEFIKPIVSKNSKADYWDLDKWKIFINNC